jgi:Flp pilus assembly protein TadB
MSAPSSAPSTKDGPPRARANYANPGMRISDAERAEVADRLSAHYGDGRLDSDEFSKRMEQAMNASTQADLHGLFADLPDDDVPAATPGRPAGGRAHPAGDGRRRGGRYNRLVAIVLVAVVAAFAVHALGWLVPWVLVAAVVFFWLRRHPQRRQARPQQHQAQPQQPPQEHR